MVNGVFVVDVDSHVYEPEAIWTDYVRAEKRPAAEQAFWRRGDELVINGAPARPLNRAHLNRQAIWHPDSSVEEIGRLDPARPPEPNAGSWDVPARLADLDALGIDHQVICPTLFGEYFPAVEDPEAAVTLACAYNDWAVDFAAGGAGRLHPSAVLPLQDLEAAVAEVDRVRDLGLNAVTLRPMFYRVPGAEVETNPMSATGGASTTNPNGVYLVHPVFEPLWDKIEQSGLVVCLHPYLGIANNEGVSEGSFTERVAEKLGIGHTVAEPVAYMEDGAMFVVVAAFHGLFEDHPNLKVALLHSGASMLPLALEKAETYLWLSPFRPAGTAPVSLEPREVFERAHTLVAFDGWESSAVRLEDSLTTKRAWGSRYPHHDASSPTDVMTLCQRYDVPEQKVRQLLGGNAAALFDLPVPAIG